MARGAILIIHLIIASSGNVLIAFALWYKFQSVGNTGRRILCMMGNEQQLGLSWRINTSTKRRTSWRFSGSNPCSGSSRINTVGCLTSARTISASRCCPQERLWKGASAVRLSIPRISSHCCASFRCLSETAW